jgi:hypothetical protein
MSNRSRILPTLRPQPGSDLLLVLELIRSMPHLVLAPLVIMAALVLALPALTGVESGPSATASGSAFRSCEP